MSYRLRIHYLATLSPKGWCCGESLWMLVRNENVTSDAAKVTCLACLKRMRQKMEGGRL